MRYPMVMLTFSVFRLEIWKYSFWTNLVQESQSYLYKLIFGTAYKSSMLNLMMMFTLSILDQKHPFCVNFVQKFKFVCLEWNLVHRLIQICGIWWRFLFFLFWTGNILFGINWSQIIKAVTSVCLTCLTLLCLVFVLTN